jgi:hypothetical protein
MPDTPTQVRSARRYMLELSGAMVLYALVLLPVIRWMNANPESGIRWFVGLLPLAPTVLAAWTILRFFERMDELARRKLTETLAFAFAVSALMVLTVGFLETAGLAPLSAWWIWVGMGSFWLIGCAVTEFRYR